jgi:predicted transcriptional regulator of viral defense system
MSTKRKNKAAMTRTQEVMKEALQVFDPSAKPKAKGKEKKPALTPTQETSGMSDAEFKLRVVLALEAIAKRR